MDTTDHVVLIVLTTLLSIFFALMIAVVIIVIKLLGMAKQIVHRADEVLASVESATETASEVFIKASNRKTFLTAVKTIYKLSKKGRK
ncbi:MAG: hypothetical protein QFB86_04535 [Patescibacteria group bacterium]|nr:hypothetical protein [Patescibacteria group bacterium]